jgi:NADPH-dependent curcumin reductase CurA
MSFTSLSVVLKASLDEGLPGPQHFDIPVAEVAVADVPEGGILIQSLVFSADPYLRGQIKSTGQIKGGTTMTGFIAGKIVHSRSADWVAGDLIGGSLPFAQCTNVVIDLCGPVVMRFDGSSIISFSSSSFLSICSLLFNVFRSNLHLGAAVENIDLETDGRVD